MADVAPEPPPLPSPSDAPDIAYLTRWAERLEYAANRGIDGSYVVASMKEMAAHLRCAIAALTKFTMEAK